MVLIKCTKCGKKFSDRMDICPYCKKNVSEKAIEQGNKLPIDYIKEQENRESAIYGSDTTADLTPGNPSKFIVIIICAVLVGFFAVWAGFRFARKSSATIHLEQSSRQQVVFIANSIRFNTHNAEQCNNICIPDRTIQSYLSEGWRITTSSPKEYIHPIEKGPDIYGTYHCICVGTEYVLEK
ncbi:MAG: hypothetical protein HQL08_14490 [Nitrospirae bacterium]|nr:hypothetical protein [Nitrospirota bacterium]